MTLRPTPTTAGTSTPTQRASRTALVRLYAAVLDDAHDAAARVSTAADGAVAVGDVVALEVARLVGGALHVELPADIAAAARRAREAA